MGEEPSVEVTRKIQPSSVVDPMDGKEISAATPSAAEAWWENFDSPLSGKETTPDATRRGCLGQMAL